MEQLRLTAKSTRKLVAGIVTALLVLTAIVTGPFVTTASADEISPDVPVFIPGFNNKNKETYSPDDQFHFWDYASERKYAGDLMQVSAERSSTEEAINWTIVFRSSSEGTGSFGKPHFGFTIPSTVDLPRTIEYTRITDGRPVNKTIDVDKAVKGEAGWADGLEGAVFAQNTPEDKQHFNDAIAYLFNMSQGGAEPYANYGVPASLREEPRAVFHYWETNGGGSVVTFRFTTYIDDFRGKKITQQVGNQSYTPKVPMHGILTGFRSREGLGTWGFTRYSEFPATLPSTVYCYNRWWLPPVARGTSPDTTIPLSTVDYNDDSVPAPRGATKKAMEWLMVLGYPYDQANLFDRFDSQNHGVRNFDSVESYRNATQLAVWAMAENTIPENVAPRPFDPVDIAVAKQLMEMAKAKAAGTDELPKNIETFYLDNNGLEFGGKPFQNFIGTRSVTGRHVPTQVTLTKEDADGKFLAGATFDLYKGVFHNEADLKKAQPIATNIAVNTERTALTVPDGLTTDTAYTLVEKSAPAGYSKMAPLVFRVAEVWNTDANINAHFYRGTPTNTYRLETHVMDTKHENGRYKWVPVGGPDTKGTDNKQAYNLEARNYKPLDLDIMKVDDDQQPLAGATLALYKGEGTTGEQVATWTSALDAHRQKIDLGITYTLAETAAPGGYLTADPIVFIVKSDGKGRALYVKENGNWVRQSRSDRLTMVDVKEGTTELRTTLEVNGSRASSSQAATITVNEGEELPPFTVTDHVSYLGLTPKATYQLTTKLMEIDGTNATAVAKKETPLVPNADRGTISVSLDNVKLDIGKKYVFYEYLTLDGTPVVDHANPQDKAQTLYVVDKKKPAPKDVTGNGSIRTRVSSNGKSAGDKTPLKIYQDGAQVNVTDAVTVENVVADSPYDVHTEVYSLAGENPVKVKEANSTHTFKSANETFTVNVPSFTADFGTTYVVYETVTSQANVLGTGDDMYKQILTHTDPSARSQQFVILKRPTVREGQGTVDTTAVIKRTALGDITATDDVPALLKGVYNALFEKVVDKVSATGLVPDTSYTINGEIHALNADGTAVVPGGPVVTGTATAQSTAQGTLTAEVTFDKSKLTPGTTYVIYETVSSTAPVPLLTADGTSVVTAKHVVAHKSPTDKSQQFTIEALPVIPEKGSLATRVEAGPVSATAAAGDAGAAPATLRADQAAQPVAVVDHITYTGLVTGEEYTFTGELWEVSNGTTVGTKSVATATATLAAGDNKGNGTFDLKFQPVQLEPGKSYVVFETAESKNVLKVTVPAAGQPVKEEKHRLEHRNPADQAQTIVVKPRVEIPADGSLATTVTAGAVSATAGATPAPAELAASAVERPVAVTDSVTYTGLAANETYVFTGKLMKVENGEAVGQPVKEATATLDAAANTGKGTIEINFGDVQLEPGTTYVVFEKAESAGTIRFDAATGTYTTHVLTHENPTDKAQTVVVKHPVTIPADGSIATQVEVAGVKATAATTGDDAAPAAPATIPASATATRQDVTDHITYTGLVAGEEYTFSGALMEVKGGALVSDTPVATASVVLAAAKNTGSGTIDLTFPGVALRPGTSYVVYETATSTSPIVAKPVPAPGTGTTYTKHVLEHKNPADQAQTIVVTANPAVPAQGMIRTTVSVGDVSATAATTGTQAAAAHLPAHLSAAPVDVVDQVAYSNLAAGEAYTFRGELVKIVDGAAHQVATAEAQLPADQNNGTGFLRVTFPNVTLEPGSTYVVFETATSVNPIVATPDAKAPGGFTYAPQVLEHKDQNDLAQTVVVEPTPVIPTGGAIATVVRAGSSTATAPAAGADAQPAHLTAKEAEAPLTVVDTVHYRGLVAGKEYTFAGSLMKIVDGAAVGNPVATATAVLAAGDNTGEGTIEVTFPDVKLEAGATYVVFEKAVSTLPIVATQGEGGKVTYAPHELSHANAADKAQTVVVAEPEPDKPVTPTPGKPDKPGKPGEPTPGQPGKPGEPTPGQPGKPGEPTPGQPGKPGEPTPGQPGKPGEPTPGQPGKPGEPTPGLPAKPGEPGKELPQTGADVVVSGALALALLAMGLCMVALRRRFR